MQANAPRLRHPSHPPAPR